MKCMNNKPTGMKLFFILFLLCRTTVEAFIPVPDWKYGTDCCTRSNGIRKVVDDWIAGGDTVETTYGLIQDWDTSDVTSMYLLFYGKTTFDADLSKWNVAKVTTMQQSTFQFHLFFCLNFVYFALENLQRIDSHSHFCSSCSLSLSLWNFCSV